MRKLILAIAFSIPCVTYNMTAQEAPPPPPPPAEGVIVNVTDSSSRLKISGNLDICKGSETILKAEGEFESFIWSKAGATGRYLRVKEEGTYEVTARTKGGCTYVASVTVRFRPCPV